MKKAKLVPARELKPEESLRAKDYVGGPEEPDTRDEEAFQEIDRQIRDGFDDDIKEVLEGYEYDESDVTKCCGAQVFVPDDPTEGPVPQCGKCGEQLPTLVDPEPSDPEFPPESCGKSLRR